MAYTQQLVDVEQIRFTQEHVYDSFNANDKRAMNVVDLIECILRGEKTPLDLPLIRVAAKKGAYWCVDNRRLFVYKHCQLGKIPVHVCAWKDNREFELKWRNGQAVRSQTSGGRRVGILQRTELPFPRSPVVEPSLSQIRHYFAPAQQLKHDSAIAALRARRGDKGAAAKLKETGQPEQVQSLLQVLGTGPKIVRAKRKKRRGAAVTDEKVMKSMDEAAADAKISTGGRRRGKRKRAASSTAKAEGSEEAVESHAIRASGSGVGGGAKLSVTLDGEDSGDEDYSVEVFAPS